jgi:methionyl aminopeptidase
MITIKTNEDLKKMREAGRIVAMTHEELKKHIVPGITTKELDSIAEKFIRKQGATPSFKGLYGFPASVCISVNEVLVHGIPGKYALKEGDIVTIDIGACYKGFHGDSAWTYPVGNISEEAKRLLEVTEASLYYGLNQAKVGNRITDISHAIQTYVESFGYSVPRDYTGHGIGREVHEDPIVPNFGVPNRGPQLKKGMTIAVEPMVNAGLKETRVLNDDWTVVTADGKLSAHFEHTVVITENGYEIFTKL